jgi:hypothetical protein
MLILGVIGVLLLAPLVFAAPYGSDIYGKCTYGDGCNISISTSGTVTLNVAPTLSSVYTIDKDTVTVTTNNSAGYTLRLESTSGTSSKLENGAEYFDTTTGTAASPVTLSNNEWGYRIDSALGFGAGPTTAVSNQTSSSLTFAGLPLLGAPQTIKTTASSALSGDATDVWYGIRADMTKPAGTYSATVVYTAVAN